MANRMLQRARRGLCLWVAIAGVTGGAACGQAPTEAQPGAVQYHGTVQGHLALPEQAGPFPGVVMIHEWWGLNDQIKAEAESLADEGYVVLAVDLYGGEVADTREEAQALVGGLDASEAGRNLEDAVAFLRRRDDVAGEKIASLGWCFGGGWSLRLLQAQPDLAAGVIYYGQVETDPERLRGLPPVLGIFGAEDASIPVSEVQAFDRALTQAGVPHEIRIYPGAGHAFANPTNGEAYRPDAAEDAWEKTLAFLARHLK